MYAYPVEIGELRQDDFPAAASLVARAMRDLPYVVAIWGSDPVRRLHGLERFVLLLLPLFKTPPLCARRRHIVVAMAGLAAPGTCVPRLGESLTLIPPLLGAGFGTFVRINRYFTGTLRRDPPERHWHIGPVAVEPAIQGLGVGSRLMAALGERMDDLGEMAHLETDLPENVRFYERAGFHVWEEAAVMGVPTWFMRRPPSTSAGNDNSRLEPCR